MIGFPAQPENGQLRLFEMRQISARRRFDANPADRLAFLIDEGQSLPDLIGRYANDCIGIGFEIARPRAWIAIVRSLRFSVFP
jgi:hypothetical protein